MSSVREKIRELASATVDSLTGREDEEVEKTPSPEDLRRVHVEDERVHVRVDVDLTVELRFASLETASQSRVINVSEGGCFIKTRSPRAEGTHVKVRIVLGERLLEVEGVVVRVVPTGSRETPGMGVLFTDLRPGQRMLLDALVVAQGGYREQLKKPRSATRASTPVPAPAPAPAAADAEIEVELDDDDIEIDGLDLDDLEVDDL